MSDLLDRAEALVERYDSSGLIHRDATLMLPELIAEIKRLRGLCAFHPGIVMIDTREVFQERIEGNWIEMDFSLNPERGCMFWEVYQKTGRFEDMTRWLKHRAYMKIVGGCIRGSE